MRGRGRLARQDDSPWPGWHNALVTQNQAPSVDQRIADELERGRPAGQRRGGAARRRRHRAVHRQVPKEATGALDDAQLRTLEERLRYLRELDERRDAILKEITAQGKLTGELEAQIGRPT